MPDVGERWQSVLTGDRGRVRQHAADFDDDAGREGEERRPRGISRGCDEYRADATVALVGEDRSEGRVPCRAHGRAQLRVVPVEWFGAVGIGHRTETVEQRIGDGVEVEERESEVLAKQERLRGDAQRLESELSGQGQATEDAVARLKEFEARELELAAREADLGRREAVAETVGIRWRGTPAWALARGYHVATLPGVKRRLRLLADWGVASVFGRDTTVIESQPDAVGGGE